MAQNLSINKSLLFITSLLSLVASLVGVLYSDIYDQVVSSEIMAGVLSQDILTIILSFVGIVLIVSMKKSDLKKNIVLLGILGYFFYGYGIYVIEQLYTPLYFVYMAIFGLALYSIVSNLINLKGTIPNLKPSKTIRILSIIFLVITPLIFYPLWISQIIPLIQTGQKLEFTFSIYILDLCFIMPLFVVTAIKTIKSINWGLLLTPSLFIVGFSVLAPLGFAEFLKPIMFDMTMEIEILGMFLTLSIIYLILAFLNLANLHNEKV